MAARAWSATAIESVTGVSRNTVRNLLSHAPEDRGTLYPTTARRLAEGLASGREPTAGHVSAIGSRRRARGAQRLGWTIEALADRAALPPSTVAGIVTGLRESVSPETARAIRAATADLPTGASWVAANAAKAAGWPPLYAWDGVDLDDPRTALDRWPRADKPGAASRRTSTRRRRNPKRAAPARRDAVATVESALATAAPSSSEVA